LIILFQGFALSLLSIYYCFGYIYSFGCFSVMDAGTSFSLKAQSRCPLQEQYMQRKNARENVISYIFLIIASNSFTISFNSLQNLNRVLRL